MSKRISALTIEHLGNVATDQDLAEFVAAVKSYMARTGTDDEQAAISYIWGNGDYYERMIRELSA